MPTVGDVLETSLCANYFDQEVCNVFHWVVAAWTGNMTLQEFAEQLAEQLTLTIGAGQSGTLGYQSITLYNLTNTLENTTRPLTQAGGLPDVGDAPFMAAPLKLIGENELTKNGWKRFGGVPDARIDAGGALTGPMNTWLTSVGNLLSNDIVVDNAGTVGGTLTPVIVGTDSLNGGKDISKINPIVSFEIPQFATTQNTRKRGRGS